MIVCYSREKKHFNKNIFVCECVCVFVCVCVCGCMGVCVGGWGWGWVGVTKILTKVHTSLDYLGGA